MTESQSHLQAEEIRRPVRRHRRQHRTVLGRQDRQRPALPRLRHPRRRRHLRIRRNRLPAGARQTADRRRTEGLQDQAEIAARPAAGAEGRAGSAAGVGPPDGRDAHRRVGAGLHAAGEGRPQSAGRARHRRPPDGVVRLDAAVLVPLQPQRQAHRVETDDDSIGGHFLHLLHGEKPSDSVGKAMHTSLILYAEHEFNASTFTAASSPAPVRTSTRPSPARSARCAVPSTAAPTKSRSRSRSATTTPTKPKRTSATASRTRKS
jgi:hypothetical protein